MGAAAPYVLYDYLPSGNGYKVRLVCKYLSIPTPRFWLTSLHQTPEDLGERLTEKLAKGHEALQVLEDGLRGHSYLAGDQFTLADIALYAYTHIAPQGGFALEKYPAINAWLQRVASQPHHTPITQP